MIWRLRAHSQAHEGMENRLARLEMDFNAARSGTNLPGSPPDRTQPRSRFRIESLIGGITLLGLLFYGTVWLGYAGFYTRLGLQAEDLGVTYTFILTRSILLIWFLALLFAGAGYITLLGIPISRPLIKYWLLGTVLLVIIGFVLSVLARITGNMILDVLGFTVYLWGALPLLRVLTEWTSHGWPKLRRRWFRLLGRISRNEISEERRKRRVRKYSNGRRRTRGVVAKRQIEEFRSTWRMRLGRLRHLPRRLLLGPACLAYGILALAFIYWGDSAADRVLDGKAPYPSGDVRQMIVTVRADPVCISPLDGSSLPVAQSDLRFLGQREGVYVLYDVANQRPMLIPTEYVVLRLLNYENSETHNQSQCTSKSP